MLTKKITQGVMIWFLPLIVIGGLFWPLLGYLALAMIISLLILSYFHGRFWCAHLCPRGAFLDIVISCFSIKKKMPRLVSNPLFRWGMFVIFICFFVWQLAIAEKTLNAVGFVFVRMCLITTIIAVISGIPIHQRIWCMFCPMGTLQNKISTLRKQGGV